MEQNQSVWLFVLILVLTGGAWIAVTSIRRDSYPFATNFPSPPPQSLSEILQQLDSRIEEHSPMTFVSLRSGLRRDEIIAIEKEYGFELTDEMRELYEWHDGISLDSGQSFFGTHQFVPLKHLAKSREAVNQELANVTGLQRLFYWVYSGHRTNWIDLFPDNAGDGYFIDPTRSAEQGAVFFNFNETGDYRFYPTLSSLMLAISECYDAEIYSDGTDASSISTIEKEHAIHRKYGTSNSQ
jgi:cell wall assembly regulator SMI1